ncbi:MAG: complex I NDUFA9 subunit family protein [Deltaproteobacteria bacterium]|nr:complex I NDUFA9 subunit family protein [Deltaproteobacteria bacterium]MBZ0219442.1 complex I NDUFA9 subunit family protein [Deltaproteobacteria bacterium]
MILLTGGTGFVGSSLAMELLLEGRSVRCLSRRPERAIALKEAGCELARGDVTSITTLLKAVTPDVEAVIHLVGILNEERGSTYRAVHVDGTRNVIDACRGMGIARLIHMSALGARASSGSEYHRTKWEAEELVRSSGLDYTIFRPSVIFGRGDHFTTIFARAMRLLPAVFVPGDGRGRMQPVSVRDVSRAFAMSLAKKEAGGKSLDLAGPEALTLDDVIDRIGAVIGRRPRKVHVPMRLMTLNALVLEKLLPRPPVSREALKMLLEDNTTSLNALVEVFGIAPESLETGMKAYLS